MRRSSCVQANDAQSYMRRGRIPCHAVDCTSHSCLRSRSSVCVYAGHGEYTTEKNLTHNPRFRDVSEYVSLSLLVNTNAPKFDSFRAMARPSCWSEVASHSRKHIAYDSLCKAMYFRTHVVAALRVASSETNTCCAVVVCAIITTRVGLDCIYTSYARNVNVMEVVFVVTSSYLCCG